MHLILVACRALPGTPGSTLSLAGDVLTLDGVAYDLSAVPEGGEGMADEATPFVGPITRKGGEIHCALRIILGDDADPDQPTDIAHWTISAGDGPVVLPVLPRKQEIRA